MLQEAQENNEKLRETVREAEMAHRAAGEQQEWFDDLRDQFAELHKKYEDKGLLLIILFYFIFIINNIYYFIIFIIYYRYCIIYLHCHNFYSFFILIFVVFYFIYLFIFF